MGRPAGTPTSSNSPTTDVVSITKPSKAKSGPDPPPQPVIPNDLYEDLSPEVTANFAPTDPKPSRTVRSTRNPNPIYVDSMEFSGPPPFRGFPVNRTWSASAADLEAINQSIRGV